jgi:microfibrillar-associated protein 1
MKKVKVHRYVSGKRPDYAPTASSDEESEEDDFMEKRGRPYEEIDGVPNIPQANEQIHKSKEEDDPRLRRLTRLDRQRENADEIRIERRRHVQEPEVLLTDINEKAKERIKLDSSESSEDEDLSDEEIERRREALKQRVLSRKEADEELIKEEDEEEKSGDSSESSSEYEEYTDSEEETGPRLKPVFVRKRDRITVMEKEKEAQKQKQVEMEAKKLVEERKKQTLRVKSFYLNVLHT